MEYACYRTFFSIFKKLSLHNTDNTPHYRSQWQIAWTAKRFSADLFVPRYDSFPMNPEKKTLIS